MRYLFLIGLLLASNLSFALQIYAHRGGRALSPENTLEAYKKALAIGVNFVDMDVNMTKDGVLVVTHDVTLNPDFTKYKNGQWVVRKDMLIKSLTLAQLKNYNVCQKRSGTGYAKMFPKQKGSAHCTIPTLREVIKFVKHIAGNRVGFQIEIKTDPEHPQLTFSPKILAKAVAKVVHEMHIVPITEVQAFDYRCLYALQKIDPKIKTAYLTQFDSRKTMLNRNPKIAALWTGGPLLKNYHKSIPYMISKLGGRLWDPQDVEVTAKSVRQAHKYGLKVVVWNWPHTRSQVFQPKMINKLINDKVDGIITDNPKKLRFFMKKRGLRVPPRIR